MLFLFCLLPAFGAFLLFFVSKNNVFFIKNFSLVWTLLVFNISIVICLSFDSFCLDFQFLEELSWLTFSTNSVVLAVDGLSIVMIVLTTFLFPVCILLGWTIAKQSQIWTYNIMFLILESILLLVFCSLDLLMFYLLFEAILIPMYFVIGVFGSRERKIRASYLLFLYTLVSSIVMFVCILFLFVKTGSTNFFIIRLFQFDPLVEKLCWLAFFSSFAVKMPIIPFHIWLPEAHCEAPTAGSVLLAGILLKLGGYGFLRFSLSFFPSACSFFSPMIYALSAFGVIYASLTTLQQIDLKKIIAYTSVGHMGLVTAGIFSQNAQGIFGSILLMLAHGITSPALFISIGFLYERYGTRIIKYYGGLIHTMPIFSVLFIIFSLANLGLPATSNFIGEFLVLVGCFSANSWATLLIGTGLVLSAGYSLWLCNRLLFGNFKSYSIVLFRDLNRREFSVFFPFVFLTFFVGLYPEFIAVLTKSFVFVC